MQIDTQPVQEHANSQPSEALVWEKPTLEVIGVSLECTAYAGAREDED
ncbi:MAG: hypothetical protein M3Y39_00065 [Chloroflexota bacterium]|nr:hypothetical protein [Chloroflexota bacterium]